MLISLLVTANLLRRDGEAESGVERRVEDVCSWAVSLGWRGELLVTPCNLDARVELVTLTIQPTDTSDQHGRKTADSSFVRALPGCNAVGLANKVKELSVDGNLSLSRLALVGECEFLRATRQEKLLDGRSSNADIVVTAKVLIVHIDNDVLLVISDEKVLDEEAVGEDRHGGEDVLDDLSHSLVDYREISDVGSVSEVKFKADKGSYDLGHHAAIQFEVTFTIPVNIHIKLDALGFSLVNINVGHSDGRWPKVKLDKA
ncbi:hypothetical protein HG530_000362 [Fusarium avenaceum]|nr:hypothetical protein HG530_000362 [Fusarium avenaceum]